MKKSLPLLAAFFVFSLVPSLLRAERAASSFLYPACRDGKWGFVDSSGRTALPFVWERARPFSEGLAWVWKDGKALCINRKGKTVFRFRAGNAAVGDPFRCGMSRLTRGEKTGFLNARGKVAIPPRYVTASHFSDGLAAVKLSFAGRYFYIDKRGKRAFKADFGLADPFSEGLAAVKRGPDSPWEYIDIKGRTAVPPRFEAAGPFSQGLAAVKLDGKWGYIDRKGAVVVEPRFDRAGEFACGLAPVELDGKWGYITPKGEFAVRPAYDYAS
ncbi:MAG: hypothetical protein DRP90_08035, partial [Planctomycetota bacterium]